MNTLVRGAAAAVVLIAVLAPTISAAPAPRPEAKEVSSATELQEVRSALEQNLEAKIARVLEPLVGAGRFVARVTIDLEPQNVVRREKVFDPESAVIVSEQRARRAGEAPAEVSTSYEYSVVEQTVDAPLGAVRRMSVALLLDQPRTNTPRTPEELAQIEQLIRTATSFDPARGDILTIEQAPFRGGGIAPDSWRWPATGDWRVGVLLAPVLLALWFAGSFVWSALSPAKRRTAPLSSPPDEAGVAAPAPALDARRRRIAEAVAARPDAAARTLRVWLQELAPERHGEPSGSLRKAAILLALVGEEAAAAVLRHFESDEIRAIGQRIARLGAIEPADSAAVLDEYETLVRESRGVERAGPPLARRLLSRVQPADEVERLARDWEAPRERPRGAASAPATLGRLAASSGQQLALVLTEENEQTIALVLAHLSSARAAEILTQLPPERRVEVTRRLATLGEVRADVFAQVVRVLERRLDELPGLASAPIDGVRASAATLAGLSGETGHEIVDALSPVDPDLSRRLRERMFAFETLRTLESRQLRELSRTVDHAVFALALKGADPELQEHLLGRLPETTANAVRGELVALAAPRLLDVERAQRTLVAEALRLEGGRVANLEEQFVDGR